MTVRGGDVDPAMQETTLANAKALFLTGLEHFSIGRYADAVGAFEASLELAPDRPATLANLGAARIEAGRPAEAIEPLTRALQADPAEVHWRSNLGVALGAAGRHAEALECHDAVLARAPERAESWFLRGQSLLGLGRHAEALDAFERATAFAPAFASAWTQRGALLREAGRLAEAAQAFREALRHGADPELTSYYLAAVEGSGAPHAAPAGYVAPFFDEYASRFDAHLTGALDYRSPKTLFEILRETAPGQFRSAVDLGCGTGLMGAHLRPVVERLEGVDLSERMLERARERRIYDELRRGELVEDLRRTAATHDLLVAADVLVYVGDLAPVYAAARDALVEGGRLAFTVEAAAEDTATYALRASLRYVHARSYVERLADDSGFAVEELRSGTLREERGRLVEGWYVVLRR